MPKIATAALRQLQEAEGRTTGPVFATRDAVDLDAANVRRKFRAAVKAAGITGSWSPRELRHTFVSLMSDSGVPVEEIARLAGHANSRTTGPRQRPCRAPIRYRLGTIASCSPQQALGPWPYANLGENSDNFITGLEFVMRSAASSTTSSTCRPTPRTAEFRPGNSCHDVACDVRQ